MKHRANVYKLDGVGWAYQAPRVEWTWVVIRGLIYGGLIPLMTIATGWFWVCVVGGWCN